MTKQELIALFSNGHLVTGVDFENLINSMKGVQSPVSDPSASGTSVTFIDTITQNAEGKIMVTKKTVNFNGFVPVIQMRTYQNNDIQVVGELENDGTGNEFEKTIEHKKGHYPTVRLLDKNDSAELRPSVHNPEPYTVKHIDTDSLTIVLSGEANAGTTYLYVLD